MQTSYNELSNIFATLPVGYYLGRRIPHTLVENETRSYFDPVNDRIIIGYQMVRATLENIPEVENAMKEFILRTLLYHEISHVMWTPKMEMTKVINIVEDTRIETLNSHKFLKVDFDRAVRIINNYKGEAPNSPDEAFYNLVRYKVGDTKWLERLANLINKYRHLNSTSDNSDVYYYINAINDFYSEFTNNWKSEQESKTSMSMPMMGNGDGSQGQGQESGTSTSTSTSNNTNNSSNSSSNDSDESNDGDNEGEASSESNDTNENGNDSNETSDDKSNGSSNEESNDKDNGDSNDESNDKNNGGSNESMSNSTSNPGSQAGSEEGTPTGEIEEGQSKDENDDHPENDIVIDICEAIQKLFESIEADEKEFKNMVNEVFNKYQNAKLSASLNTIIQKKLKKDKRNGSAINSYSGRFNVRAVAERDDYRWWIQSNRYGHIRQFSKVHFNLFIDNSGSFRYNDVPMNTFIRALDVVSKSNPDFTFDVITINTRIVEWPDHKRMFESFGGTRLPAEVKDVLKKHTKPNVNTTNIVLFDGDADPESGAFRTFDTLNTCIITDPENERYVRNFKKAKVNVTRDYYNTFIDTTLKLLEKVI